jgi:hypothetical protein
VHWHRLTGDEQRCLGTPHEWWDLGLGLALPSAQSVTDHANDASGHRERLSKKTQYGAYLFHALSCLVHSSVGRASSASSSRRWVLVCLSSKIKARVE